MRISRRAASVIVSLGVVLAGTVGVSTSATADAAGFTVRPSVNQVYVLGATPGEALELVDAGRRRRRQRNRRRSSAAWPGASSTPAPTPCRDAADPATASAPFVVTDFDDPPPAQSFYDGQTLGAGLRLPHHPRRHHAVGQRRAARPAPAPYPTVVEYSGYDPSNPANTTMAQLFTALGFAYVGVNIRGTGCSGGSFLNFEPVQSLDGYDAIEAIAAQPWAQVPHRPAWSASPTRASPSSTSRRPEPPHLCRDHPAVGHRRHLPRHALPRRHPQHRIRRPVGRRARRPRPRRTARAGSSPASTPATPSARPTSSCACRTPTRSP